MSTDAPYDFPDLTEEAVEIWDTNAEWWDDKIGDGNNFQIHLIEPSTHRLLDAQPGQQILDIACGAGRSARQIADRGAEVIAIDHSEKFIRRAIERSGDYSNSIEYRTLNAADTAALLALGEGRFDSAVCTMALMDMAEISPLISTLPKLLKPGGIFVFSITHPAFNSSDFRRHAESKEIDGVYSVEQRVSISRYATAYPYLGLGILGQPRPHRYFHRSFSTLLGAFFKNGFVLDGMEEPTLPEPEGSREREFLGFTEIPDIPPVLIARMRLQE